MLDIGEMIRIKQKPSFSWSTNTWMSSILTSYEIIIFDYSLSSPKNVRITFFFNKTPRNNELSHKLAHPHLGNVYQLIVLDHRQLLKNPILFYPIFSIVVCWPWISIPMFYNLTGSNNQREITLYHSFGSDVNFFYCEWFSFLFECRCCKFINAWILF